jgi:CubicO group peptidase (beta-lactamase class C family)
MRRVQLLATAAILCNSCATTRPTGEAPLNPSHATSLAEAWEQIDQDAAATVAAHHWSDLALGVVHKGKLVFFRGYGARDRSGEPVTEETVFRFGSITKSFTDLVLLQLRDEGKLSIDAPVEVYLPEIRGVVYPTGEHPPITLRQMMNHSSGLPRLGRFDYTTHAPTEQEALASLQGLPLNATPGTSSEYSNFALCLAGVVVQRVAGTSYHDAVKTRIFEPLGMKAGFAPDDFPSGRVATGHDESGKPVTDWSLGVCDSAGGIYGSLDDLSRWAILQLSAWPPGDAPESKVASRATLREAQSGASPFLEPESVQGMGWVPADQQQLGHVVWHNGATLGYSGELWMLSGHDLAVVALLGTGSGENALQHLVRQTLATLRPFFPKPAPVLSEWMKAKVTTLFQSLEPGSTTPTDLYSESYLAAPKDPPELTKDTAQREIGWLLEHTGGSCTVTTVNESKPFYAAFRARCGRGGFDMHLWLSSMSPYSIDGFRISDAK